MSTWTPTIFYHYCDKQKGSIFSKGFQKISGWRRFDEHDFPGFGVSWGCAWEGSFGHLPAHGLVLSGSGKTKVIDFQISLTPNYNTPYPRLIIYMVTKTTFRKQATSNILMYFLILQPVGPCAQIIQ